jgi:sigma-E factor negative regulatory protein RseB
VHRGWLRWLGAALVPLCSAVRAEDVAEWLSRLQAAQAQRGYEGVVIYVHDGRVDQIRIVSRPGIDAYQRFASLSGGQREILKSGGEVRALDPTQAPVAWPAMAAPAMRVDTQRVTRLYRMQMAGSDRVAGYSARLIEAAPQDGYRYGQRLWVDQETGLLLGAALLGPRRETLEQVMFAQLALEGGSHAAPAAAPTVVVDEHGTVKLLPGFVQIGGRIDPARGLEQRVYSDGLATVSLYIERREGAQPGEFATRRGAVQLYGRQAGPLRIVAVGAVPPESTRRMVDATFAALAEAAAPAR